MSYFTDYNNVQVARLPKHLRQYIVDQRYEKYSPVDQAVWRYVMRQNYFHLKDVAYYPYIPGLKAAGLSIEKIPHLQEMNDALGKIGWGAVTVDGFIPPAAFMEYQSYKVLVIAADIRQLEHIEYTPAPDIIHESAGHAPIIAEPDYHEYLRYFGSIGAKAMYSAADYDLYEAIRALSILKETSGTPRNEILQAEKQVQFCSDNLGEPSEMALLSRLHWWTVEYGLIGTLENPKIYGAGLLSSIGESASCMKKSVKKLWYSIETQTYAYDITKPQPQLFVTPDFQNLTQVLEEFSNGMAFRKGGLFGVIKAIQSKNTATVELSSGLQISGTFTDVGFNTQNEPYFIRSTGSVALAYNNKEIIGQGKEYHADGYSTPLGNLKDTRKSLDQFSPKELAEKGVAKSASCTLQFTSGITVEGKVLDILWLDEKPLIIRFKNCTVKGDDGKTYFRPEWGIFDMALGGKVVSVFSGAADKTAFEDIIYTPKSTSLKTAVSPKTKQLFELYAQVRKIRETKNDYENLTGVWQKLQKEHPADWLCATEILEILNAENIYAKTAHDIMQALKLKAAHEKELKKLIADGFVLAEKPGGVVAS